MGSNSYILSIDPSITIKCFHENCKGSPLYQNPENKSQLFCKKHKLTNHKFISYKLCAHPNCKKIAKKIFDGKCDIHAINNFEKIDELYHRPQNIIMQFIKNHFADKVYILFDTTIPNGRSTRHPDIFIDMGTYVIIIEIDENQHKTYSIDKEKKRYDDIINDLQSKPVIFIRFNPHFYKNNKKTIYSYWMQGNKTNPKYLDDWNNRLNELKNTVEYYINNSPQKDIEIIKLFYDN
jgi:hypothetical protein